MNTGLKYKKKRNKHARNKNTQDTKNYTRKTTDMNSHTETEGKQDEGRATNTHCVRVRGSPNEKNSQHTKEPATEQKGGNVRKREIMCEITHRKVKKKTKETWPV